MVLIDKTLVIIVTRNNPVLIKYTLDAYKRHPAGVPCDFLIVDNESTDAKQLDFLNKQSFSEVCQFKNDRVEVSFDSAWRIKPNYRYYFFVHDDCIPHHQNWLKPFIDCLSSTTCEPIIKDTHLEKLPVGRVGALTHPWRDYSSILGYPVQCYFLKACLTVLYGENQVPPIFKYADCDRVLITNECLVSTNGIPNIAMFQQTPQKENLKSICRELDHYLRYEDEGTYPLQKYPAGKHWNRLTLLSEFLNSTIPLIKGYRTSGVDNSEYLEQIHGEDSPLGHRYIAHFGAPNALQALAKYFNTDSKEVKNKMNDIIFLTKSEQYFSSYYKDRINK